MAQYRGPNGRFISLAVYNQMLGNAGLYPDGGVSIKTSQILNDVARQVRQGVASQVSLELSTMLKKYVNIFYKEASGAALTELHKSVGEGARAAVKEAYLASGIGEKASYRWNDQGVLKRYSNEAMQRAFDDPNFVTYNNKSISFANRATLDSYAKQWYRLNFGAAPGNSVAPSTSPMRFSPYLGGVTQTPGAELTGFPPSKPFNVPMRGLGMWSSTAAGSTPGKKLRPGKPGQFLYVGTSMVIRRSKNVEGTNMPGHPKSGGHNAIGSEAEARSPFFTNKPSKKGITGKRFLDAGSEYINVQYPLALESLIKGWEAAARAGI